MNNTTRYGISLVILVLIFALWCMTISSWYGCVISVQRAVFSLFGTVAGIVSVYFLLGSKSTKEKGQNIALLFGSIIFCLVLLEVPVLLFRVSYQDTFQTSADTELRLSEGINKPDPILIHIHWPNSSFSGEV